MNVGNEKNSGAVKHCICRVCGKHFDYRSTGRPPLYCSDDCKCQARLDKSGYAHVCETCGESFVALQKDRRYCSKVCSGKAKTKVTHYRNKHVKTCITCGKQFETIDVSQQFCSPECVSTHNRRYNTCQLCGKPFWRRNAFRMKFCSIECRRKAQHQEMEERQRSQQPREKTTYHRSCALCGNVFITAYPNHIYCSFECCYSANLRTQREQWAEAYTPRTFVCKECGCRVTTECGKTRREFCSEICEHKYHDRAYKIQRSEQMKAAHREPVSFKRIYHRDHGLCGICGLPVPYDKAPEKIWSATIDHIIPLSQGGTHEPGNCQLAHRLCNSIKMTDAQEFHIDWEQKNKTDCGRWSEALLELDRYINTVSVCREAPDGQGHISG